MSRRIAIAGLSLMVAAIAVMIFLFSAQSGEDSGKLSGGFATAVIRIAYRDYDRLSPEEQSRIMQQVQYGVRKTAHFTEYALLGVFLCLLLRRCGCRHPGVYAWLSGTLYAGTDELHQLLGGTRTGTLRDVGIDSAGVLFGLCLALALQRALGRARGKRKRP